MDSCEMIDKIYNCDCEELMNDMIKNNLKVDLILTSPPYNITRSKSLLSIHNQNDYHSRYDIYLDFKKEDEYIDWCINLFNLFDDILKENGVIIWNVSYSSYSKFTKYKNNICWLVISNIITNTQFMVADKITWVKKTTLPNASFNKLTRITEDVFIFCREKEFNTFFMNKELLTINKNNKYHSVINNIIYAKNNDGSNPFNKATFSTELVTKLLNIYAPNNAIVYDPFMGTGTTAVACMQNSFHFIGSELSWNQCKYAEERIRNGNNVKNIITNYDDFNFGLLE